MNYCLSFSYRKKTRKTVRLMFGLWLLASTSLSLATSPVNSESDLQCGIKNNGLINPAVITSMIEAARKGALYRVDTKSSNVKFQVNHFPFSRVEGHFNEFQGGVTIPVDDAPSRQALFLIKGDSVSTGDKDLDDYIKGSDFFDTLQFPEIIFISTAFEWIDNSTARLYGELTLRGTTRPLVFIARIINDEKNDIDNDQNLSMLARAKIKRSDFGMHEMQLLISDTVHFDLKIEASRVGI